MSDRKSVFEPKPGVVFADDQELVPHLDWRRRQTWGVFAGWALGLGTTSSLITPLCWIAAKHLIDDDLVRARTAMLAALVLCMIGAMTLKRAIPLRDISGRIVAGKSRLNFGSLPRAPFLAMAWVMSFFLVFFALFDLVRDPAGINPAEFPFGIANVPAIISFVVFEVPFRVLWRAPVREQEPHRNE